MMEVSKDQLVKIFDLWAEEQGADRPADYSQTSAVYFEELLGKVKKKENEIFLSEVPLQ